MLCCLPTVPSLTATRGSTRRRSSSCSDGAATWLLASLDPEYPDIAFGLCDLGFGCPEMGSVCLSEIETVRGRMGLRAERDIHFVGQTPLSAYARDARRAGKIVTG